MKVFDIGWSGEITGYSDDRIAKHLLAVGLTPGKTIRIVGRSPFGQTYRVQVQERSLALRALELESIKFNAG